MLAAWFSKKGSEGRHFPFLISLAVLFLLYPVMVELDIVRLFRLAFALVLVSAVYTLGGTRRHLITALALGVPAMLAQLVVYTFPGRLTLVVGTIFGLAFLGYTTVVILGSVLRPGRVTGDKIAGAIAVYLLLGLLWALLYGVIAAAQPGAFRAPEDLRLGEALGTGAEYAFIYYSFVTLTTLGYGEISPALPLSRSFAWMEAVTGQLFLAILIARLVALHIAQGRKRES